MKSSSALHQWLAALTEAVTGNTFIKLTVKKPKTATDLKSIDVRPIMVKRALKLSFTYHYKTRDIVKNHTPEESSKLLQQQLTVSFDAASLHTTTENLTLAKAANIFVLTRQPATQTTAPDLSHDQPKQRLLTTDGKAYLTALGLTDADGKVLKTAQDKFRQINKYIEILDGLVKQLPAHQPLRIVDMGSGKGYLTFALYDHLANTLGRQVDITGVEYRHDLVTLCNGIAIDAGFTGLRFVQGAIADFDCAEANVVIALHACDTATDDALFKAIQAKAELIVVAPCCHKQIRREMTPTPGHDLDFLLRHGTYTERIAEMVTDGLRAQLLELHGYGTKVFEFISDAHTPKNVMIVATRSSKKPDTAKIRAGIGHAKAKFGIRTHYLEHLLLSLGSPR